MVIFPFCDSEDPMLYNCHYSMNRFSIQKNAEEKGIFFFFLIFLLFAEDLFLSTKNQV